MIQLKNKWWYRSVILIVLFLLAAAIWNLMLQSSNPPKELEGVLRLEPKSLSSFNLVDQNNQLINEHIFEDKWTFVFFGYTSCPDICPTTLQMLNAVVTKLDGNNGEPAGDVQVIFVSVDPVRDTSAKIASYMEFFNKSFIGLTGDEQNIDNITKQFNAGYMRGQEISPGHYLVAHTSAIFLVAPDTKLVAAFSQPHIPKTIISQFKDIKSYLLVQ